MGRSSLGTVRQSLGEKYSQEADELGISRAEYTRKCIEVGRLIFRTSGEFDIGRLRTLTEEMDSSIDNNDLETVNGDLTTTILNNLPTDETRALSIRELQEVVYGTKKEQNKRITEALKTLRHQGKIETLVEGGYVKTEKSHE